MMPVFEEEFVRPPDNVPVFPLEHNVLLPGEPMPLHIFEDRYRQMTESALYSERLITLAHVKPREIGTKDSSLYYPIAGLGKIAMEERLEDGRYNLLLVGLKRVRIKNLVQQLPYKVAHVEILADQFSDTNPSLIVSLNSEVTQHAERLVSLRKKKQILQDSPLTIVETRSTENLPLGALCDVLASLLQLSPLEKQMILEETDVIQRAQRLIFIIEYEIQSLLGNNRNSSLRLQ